MMKVSASKYSLFILTTFLMSCLDEQYEPATVTFYPALAAEMTEPEAGSAAAPYTIRLKTSRILPVESQVNIRITGNGAGYGYSYVTSPPELEPGLVTITIPAGETDAQFTFAPKNDGLFVPRNYDYTFSITQTSNAIKSVGQGQFSMRVFDSTEPFLKFDFNNCTSTPVGMTEQIVQRDDVMQVSTWGCTSFGYPDETTNAAEANAFGKGASGASNSYLVLPVINADNYSDLFFSMQVYSRFTGPGVINVRYSTNYSGTGDPEADGVTWIDLEEANAAMPAAGSRNWVQVSQLLENVSGQNFYFAIQYVGGTSASASNWRIDELEIKGN
jgi:hypothetical protein